MILPLLLGILIAASLFAGLVWSLGQAFFRTGGLRLAHIASALTLIAAFAVVTYQETLWALPAGAALALAAGAATVLDRGWGRVLPGVQVLFGLLVASGLPFQGG